VLLALVEPPRFRHQHALYPIVVDVSSSHPYCGHVINTKAKEFLMPERTINVLRTVDDRVIPVAGVYEIDAPHTSVEFVGRHLMITKVRGRFSGVRGQIAIAEDPTDSHVEVEIDVASVSTGNDDRDAHLKSGDFFDVEHYPTITFASTAVKSLRDNTWEVAGDLTVHGTTKPVTLQVDFDGGGASPMGDERIGFSAATEVNREDFGLTWNVALETGGILVGKSARIELAVQAIATGKAAVA
jgi:polyisoprenoid-binding protein YceI